MLPRASQADALSVYRRSLSAKEDLELMWQVIEATVRRARLREATLTQALLVKRKSALRARNDALRAAGSGCRCAGIACAGDRGEGADDVEGAGVSRCEGLEEDVGLALTVVIVVQQALRHDKDLAGLDLKVDVLRG
jgi:hypothetical protein